MKDTVPGASPAESPTANAPQATGSRGAMLARFNQLEGAASAATSVDSGPSDDVSADVADEDNNLAAQPTAQGDNDEGEAETDEVKAKSEKKSEKPKKTHVSVETFKKRVDEITAQKMKAENALAQRDLTLLKQRRAIDLLNEQVARLTDARKAGDAYDERDEEIETHRLRQRADEAARLVDQEHQKRLAQHAKLAVRQRNADAIAVELDDALSQHPLVSADEVIRAAKKDPERPLSEVAAEVEAKKAEVFRQRYGVAAKPATNTRSLPTTIRQSPGGHVRRQHPPTKAGMLARFNELEALKQG